MCIGGDSVSYRDKGVFHGFSATHHYATHWPTAIHTNVGICSQFERLNLHHRQDTMSHNTLTTLKCTNGMVTYRFLASLIDVTCMTFLFCVCLCYCVGWRMQVCVFAEQFL